MHFESLEKLPHWLGMLILPLGAALLLIAKHFIFNSLRRWTKQKDARWDELLLNSMDWPLTLLLVSIIIGFIPVAFSMPDRWQKFVLFASKLSAVAAFAIFVQKLLLALHHRYLSRWESLKTYAGMTRVFISIAVYTIFLLIFLDTAGISITPLVASLGVGSIAVALALQDTLSNFFSGIYIVVDQPIRVGDYIKMQSGEEGYVKSIGWRSVWIQMLTNNIIVVPNSKLSSSIITNYSINQKELGVVLEIGVDYESDLEKVEKITLEVAREIMKSLSVAVQGFEPSIRYHTFADTSIQFTVALRGKEYIDQFVIKHEFIKRLHQRYKKEGISIPVRVRAVQFKNLKDE